MRKLRPVGVLLLIVGAALLVALRSDEAFATRQTDPDRDAWLGVYLQDLTDAMREALHIESDVGVLVSDVVKDSPAEKAGLKVGDVIVEFDGRRIEEADDLVRAVRRSDPGDKVKVVIIRDGKRRTLTVELGEKPRRRRRVYGRAWGDWRSFVRVFAAPDRLGIELAELNPELAAYFDVEEGALILEVEEDSPADRAGLQPGDVIVAIEGEKVRDPEDVTDILSDYGRGDKVEIEIVRHGKHKKVTAELSGRRRWRRRYGDFPGLFYFFQIPDSRRGDGWDWNWDWDWGRGRGWQLWRIPPKPGVRDEVIRMFRGEQRPEGAIIHIREAL